MAGKRIGSYKCDFFSLKYGTCALCHKIEKLSGYICYKCCKKEDHKEYYSRLDVRIKAHDLYCKRKSKK